MTVIKIRGTSDPVEIAAVLAVLNDVADRPDPLREWRKRRRAAIVATIVSGQPARARVRRA